MRHTLRLEDLNCAHCAAKIETKIAQTEGYDKVSFNFATKKLQFECEDADPVAAIQAICDGIEDGVHVKRFDEHHHAQHVHDEHHAHCCADGCGHEHGHGHGDEEQDGGRIKKILLAAAVALGIAALAVHLAADGAEAYWTVFGLSLAAALAAGYDVFLKGVKNAFRLRIEETVLMTVAVIAAFFLGEFVEAAMVTILFSIGEFIEDLAVGKSRRDIEKLSKIRPDTATVLENGQSRTVHAEDVAVGATIVVNPHERVPLDGVVLEGSSFVDTSALTGESVPVNVEAGSEVLSGSMNGDGLLTLRTVKSFGESTATRILRLVEDAAAQKGQREKFITRFANVYTPVVVGLAVLIAVLPPLLGFGSFQAWLYKALIVLVASCPCAIVISVPLAYYSGIGAGSRLGVLMKGGRYLEALANADCFAFDKTGTLTTGAFSVKNVTAYGDFTKQQVLDLAAACEKHSAHPIALAIKKSGDADAFALTDYREIAGSGTSAKWDGRTVACGNARLIDGKAPESMQTKNAVYLVADGVLVGSIEMEDTLRAEAKGVLEQLDGLGVKKKLLLTGDSAQNAAAAAKLLPGMTVRAELLPQDKLDIITAEQESGGTVCFVGDGINDAPVLSKSDCGVAMGLGSEAAIEAADVVLSAGDLTALPKAVRLARKTLNTIRANIIFALAVKAAVIILAFFGLAQMWMSVLADTGVCVICVLYTARLLKAKTE